MLCCGALTGLFVLLFIYPRGCAPGYVIVPFQGFSFYSLSSNCNTKSDCRSKTPAFRSSPLGGVRGGRNCRSKTPAFQSSLFGGVRGAAIATRKHLHFSSPPWGELEGARAVALTPVFLHRIYKSSCMIYRNVWCDPMSQICNVQLCSKSIDHFFYGFFNFGYGGQQFCRIKISL